MTADRKNKNQKVRFFTVDDFNLIYVYICICKYNCCTVQWETHQISNLIVVSSRATVWVRKAAPIVGSWNSKNSSRTNRTTKHDFPTAVSPNNTNLKWCIRVFVLLLLLLLVGCFINILLLLFILSYLFVLEWVLDVGIRFVRCVDGLSHSLSLSFAYYSLRYY